MHSLNGYPAPHRLHLPELLVVVSLIVFTAVVFIPIQRYLGEQMEELKEQAVSELESRIGRSISYRSISPSILRAVEIRGLVINGNGTEPDRLLEIDRLRLFYHPFRLLLGASESAAAEVRIEDTTFNLHHERDEDVINLARRLATGGEGGNGQPPLELSGHNLDIQYTGPNLTYELEDVTFHTAIGSEEIQISWESSLSAGGTGAGETATNISAFVDVRGTVRPGDGQTYLRVSLPWLRTPLFRVTNQNFDLSYDDNGVEVRKLRNNDPVDLTVSSDPELGEVRVSLLADGFVPQDVVTLRGALSPFNPWLLGEVTGTAEVLYDRASGHLAYTADLQGNTNNPALPEQVALSLRVRGDESRAEVEELSVSPSRGSLQFTGSVALPEMLPQGTVRLAGFAYGPSNAPASGVLRIDRSASGRFTARTSRLSYGSSVIYDLELGTTTDAPTVDYRASMSFDEGGRSGLRVSGTLTENRDLTASVSLVHVPAGKAYKLAGELADLPNVVSERLATVVVDTAVDFTLRGDELTFEAPFVSVRDTEEISRYASFGARLTGERLVVENLVAGVDGTLLKGEFDADLSGRRAVPFQTNLRLDGRAYAFTGKYLPGQSVELSGGEGLTAQIYYSREGRLMFAATADDVPLPSQTGDRRLSMRAGGSFASAESWSVRVREFALEDVAGPDSALSLSVEADPQGGSISTFAYRDSVSRLKGQGAITYGEGSGTQLTLSARAADSAEAYGLLMTYRDATLGGTVEITESPLKRLAAEPIRGGLNGTLEMETLLTEPRLTLQFETENASFNADSIGAQGTVRLTERSLVMNRVDIRYLTRTLSDARGTIDFESGDATFSASFENRESDEDEGVKALLRASFAESALPLELSELGTVPFDAVVRLAGVRFPEGNTDPWELRVTRSTETVSVEGGPEDSLNAFIDTDGSFNIRLSQPLPFRFSADGTLTAGVIEANVTNMLVDVDALGEEVGEGTVRLTGGQFSGALRVVGPVNDPDFYGTLEANNVRSTIDFIEPPLGPADTFIVFQEKVAEIKRFQAPAGDGGGYLSGTIIFNRWAPEEYRLRIEAPDEPGVHVVDNFGGLFVDGRGRGELKIQGTRNRADISGTILVDDTSLTIGENVEPADRERGRAITTVDLQFRTTGPTEFLWPNQDFPVLRALAERGEEINLTYASDTGSFSLIGRMNIQAGEIYYFDRSFYIRDGHIIFNEDEEEFDPRLAVRAEIREISNEGPVRVFLIVDEERLSSFTPRFESSPPLSDTELIALLGGNLLTQEGQEDVDFSQAVLLTSDLVTQFGVINRFERSVRDALGLDLFSVRTQLFQNLVLGSLGQPQYPLDNTSPSLGKYFENTTVFLGKYLGSELFLELLFGLRSRSPFEPIPPGAGPVELEAEIGLEWQTPLFLLQWRFFPRNPDTLFVTDNQLEFSWEFSY
jgi:hypothetical protein